MLPSLVILASYTLDLSTRVLYLLLKDNYTKSSILCFNPSHFSSLLRLGFPLMRLSFSGMPLFYIQAATI